MNGTRLRAAATPIVAPVAGDPVKLMRRTRGSATNAAPTSAPMPWTTLKTPGGIPAAAARSQSSEQLSGDHSAGLSTTVLPAASAGAVFHVESMKGAFQGVITTVGPAGIRSTSLSVPLDVHRRGA